MNICKNCTWAELKGTYLGSPPNTGYTCKNQHVVDLWGTDVVTGETGNVECLTARARQPCGPRGVLYQSK